MAVIRGGHSQGAREEVQAENSSEKGRIGDWSSPLGTGPFGRLFQDP